MSIPATPDSFIPLMDRPLRGAVALEARGHDQVLGLVFDGGIIVEVRFARIYDEEESAQALMVIKRKLERENATLRTLDNIEGPAREGRINKFRARVDDLEVPDWLGVSTLAEEGELSEREINKRARRADSLAGTVPDV
jgi:hypothetical protein